MGRIAEFETLTFKQRTLIVYEKSHRLLMQYYSTKQQHETKLTMSSKQIRILAFFYISDHKGWP